MASTSKKRLRSSDDDVFLVGKCNSEIVGAKLPSIKQVLQVFFYQIRHEKLNAKESAGIAVDLAIPFWNKARIPTQTKQNCIKKLETLHNEWKTLKKHVNSQSKLHRERENSFYEKIDEFLFDIATPDALETIKIPEDKIFLLEQRKKGRPGSMLGIDKKLVGKEKRKVKRMQEEYNRKQKNLKRLPASDALKSDDDDSIMEHPTIEEVNPQRGRRPC